MDCWSGNSPLSRDFVFRALSNRAVFFFFLIANARFHGGIGPTNMLGALLIDVSPDLI